MNPLQEGIPPRGNDFCKPRLRMYFRLWFERDEDTARLLWPTIEWKEWLLGWLPYHFVSYIHACRTWEAICRHDQFGDWWVIPDGYTHCVLHKTPSQNGTYDPLLRVETVGIKFTYTGQK